MSSALTGQGLDEYRSNSAEAEKHGSLVNNKNSCNPFGRQVLLEDYLTPILSCRAIVKKQFLKKL